MEDFKQMAKAWGLDNGSSKEDIKKAWDAAIDKGIASVENLAKHGFSRTRLPPHLLRQPVDRYLKCEICDELIKTEEK